MRGFELGIRNQPFQENDGLERRAGIGLQEWQRACMAEQAAVSARMVRLARGEQPGRLPE